MKKIKIVLFISGVLLLNSCGYNKIQGLDEEVKASWAEVENQYQRRLDLIPNLVATVKGSAKHEKDTLVGVAEARSKISQMRIGSDILNNPEKFKQYEQSQGALSSALSRLMVVSEQYPDLKANAQFQELQSQLEGTENRITVARKRFIEIVAEYNKSIRFFPTNFTAKYLLHLEVKPTFTVTNEAAKEAPSVKFE